MDKLLESLTQYGLPGAVLAVLFAYVVFLQQQHRAERKEWLDFCKEAVTRADSAMKENNEVLRGLSVVIATLQAVVNGK